MSERWFAAALLVAALGAIAWFLWGTLPRRGWLAGRSRNARHVRLAVKSWIGFALPTLVALALLGRVDALTTMPAEFADARRWLDEAGLPADPETLAVTLEAVAAGAALGLLIVVLLHRVGRRAPRLGNVATLLPRRRGELPMAAALAMTAGVTEELFFRLLLPLLLALVTGRAVLAFGLATALFGLVHRSQGRIGMAATAAVGGLLATLYLWSGSLPLVIAAHVLLDVQALVLRPALTGAWRREAPMT